MTIKMTKIIKINKKTPMKNRGVVFYGKRTYRLLGKKTNRINEKN